MWYPVSFQVHTTVRYEPVAPLPASVPPIGSGDATLTGVTPTAVPPATPSTALFTLARDCSVTVDTPSRRDSDTPCDLLQLARYIHNNVTRGRLSNTACSASDDSDVRSCDAASSTVPTPTPTPTPTPRPAFVDGACAGTAAARVRALASATADTVNGAAPAAAAEGTPTRTLTPAAVAALGISSPPVLSLPYVRSRGAFRDLNVHEERLVANAAAGRRVFHTIVSQHAPVTVVEEMAAVAAGCHLTASRPLPPVPSRLDFGAVLTAEGKRVGIEVGVQRGKYLEVRVGGVTCAAPSFLRAQGR